MFLNQDEQLNFTVIFVLLRSNRNKMLIEITLSLILIITTICDFQKIKFVM